MDRMYKVDKNFTWDQYFKQIDIYQGRSHWTTVKRLIYKLKGKVQNTIFNNVSGECFRMTKDLPFFSPQAGASLYSKQTDFTKTYTN